MVGEWHPIAACWLPSPHMSQMLTIGELCQLFYAYLSPLYCTAGIFAGKIFQEPRSIVLRKYFLGLNFHGSEFSKFDYLLTFTKCKLSKLPVLLINELYWTATSPPIFSWPHGSAYFSHTPGSHTACVVLATVCFFTFFFVWQHAWQTFVSS